MGKAVKNIKAKPEPKSKADKEEKPDTPEQIAAKKAYEDHREKVTHAVQIHTALPHGQKDTPEMREAFLSWLRLGATPSKAAKECCLGRRTVFDWRDKDEEFKQAWTDAVETGIHRLEDEATRRAVEGVDRPVFQGGECVGFVREYSDDLLKFMLSARDPGRFSRNGQNGAGPTGDVHFTFNFGNTQVKVGVRAPVDGSVSDGSDLQRGPVLSDRGDDEGGEDSGLPRLVNGTSDPRGEG